MTQPKSRPPGAMEGRGVHTGRALDPADLLAALYAEQLPTRPEYRPSTSDRPSRVDYPPVTEQEALRHQREAVAEMDGWAELYRHNDDEENA